jgi:hypothetical protein
MPSVLLTVVAIFLFLVYFFSQINFTRILLQYTPYKVKVKSGAPLNFRLCDTRGLEESQGLDVVECNYLLDGNMPNYYQVCKKNFNLYRNI